MSQQALGTHLDSFNLRAPLLVFGPSEWLLQHGTLTVEQRSVLSHAVTAERYLHRQAEVLVSEDSDVPREAVSVRGQTYDEARAVGAIAAFWSCQVALAASVERALVRVQASKDALRWKQCHSAHSARSLMRWTGASAVFAADRLGVRHPAALGAEEMMDRFCAALTECLLARESRPRVHPWASKARGFSQFEPFVLAG